MQPIELASHLAAAVPFLPAGKGATILILGGLAVLPLSLFMSRLATGTRWIGGIEKRATRLGLGPCRIVTVDDQHCIVSLAACGTCAHRTAGTGPCERERSGLELTAQRRAPEASVTELRCSTAGQRGCTFEIYRGRSA